MEKNEKNCKHGIFNVVNVDYLGHKISKQLLYYKCKSSEHFSVIYYILFLVVLIRKQYFTNLIIKIN